MPGAKPRKQEIARARNHPLPHKVYRRIPNHAIAAIARTTSTSSPIIIFCPEPGAGAGGGASISRVITASTSRADSGRFDGSFERHLMIRRVTADGAPAGPVDS